MDNNSVTPQPKITKPKTKKQSKPTLSTQQNKFKQKYFEFYDDIKTHNNGPYDW